MKWINHCTIKNRRKTYLLEYFESEEFQNSLKKLSSDESFQEIELAEEYFKSCCKKLETKTVLVIGGENSDRNEIVKELSYRFEGQHYSRTPTIIQRHCSLRHGNLFYLIGGECNERSTNALYRLDFIQNRDSNELTLKEKKLGKMPEEKKQLLCQENPNIFDMYSDLYELYQDLYELHQELLQDIEEEEQKQDKKSISYIEKKRKELTLTVERGKKINPSFPKLRSMKWKKLASMNEKRSGFAAVVFQEKIVVAGGDNITLNRRLRCSESYPLSFNESSTLDYKWEKISSLNEKRYRLEMVVCKDSVYALGGISEHREPLSSVERLSDLKGYWEPVCPMITSKSCFAAVNCNDFIYAIGGISWSLDAPTPRVLYEVEKYDPKTKRWITVSSLNMKRYCHRACVLQGKIFVIGGSRERRESVKEIECYIPSRDKWVIVGKTTEKFVHHSIIVRSD